MGNSSSDALSQSTESGDKMLDNLRLYDQTTSPIFGPIQILKQTKSPFKYIMVYTQNAIKDGSSLRKMEQKLNWYRSLKLHAHMVGVQGVRLVEKNQMCVVKLSLQIYTKYYNWTISDAIARKLQRNQRFKEGDYIYLLQSMISILRFFGDMPHRRAFERFTIHNLFITPQGHIRMHPFPIQVELAETPNKKTVKNIKPPTSLLMSSEQCVLEMSPKKSQPSSSLTASPIKKKKTIINQRDDLRDVGLILFCMMLLNNDTEEIEDYSQQKIVQMIEQLRAKCLISQCMQQIMMDLLVESSISCQSMEMRLNHMRQNDTVSTAILRLQQGPQFIQPKEIEKNYNFKRLAQHKQLRTGSITILSKHKKTYQQ